MKTKLSQLKKAAALGDWKSALSIASKFPRLGDEKEDILKANEAFKRPEFQIQLGRDIDALKRNGINALKGKYNV